MASPPRAKATSPSSRKPAAKKKVAEDLGERLHVRIAHSGLCSRRAAEKLIQEGRVEVNGGTVTEMGRKVTEEDEIVVDGQLIQRAQLHTVLLNKPTGVVTTMHDPQGRPTILRFLPDYGVQLKPVGRLDMDTEGLLLCTNDGELALRLTHPSFGVEKEYMASVKGIPTDKALKALREGVFIEGRNTAPAKVDVTFTGDISVLKIIIHEGRKRQIRMMCDYVGFPVTKLKRTRIGPLKLKGMRPGECIHLGKKDVDELRKLVGLEPA